MNISLPNMAPQNLLRRYLKNPKVFDEIAYTGSHNRPTSIQQVVYNREKIATYILQEKDDIVSLVKPSINNWFRVVGFSDAEQIASVCKSYGLHRFDVKYLLSSQQIVKVEEYDNATMVLLSHIGFGEKGELKIERIAFILTSNSVFSFQEDSPSLFDDVLSALQNSMIQLRERGVDFLLSILLSKVVGLYNDAVLKIDEKLDYMEDEVLNLNNSTITLPQIHAIRSEYMAVRRIVVPLREDMQNQLRNSNKLIGEDIMDYYHNLQNQLRYVSQNVEICHESISSILEIYYNNNSLRMNEIMKRLTVVSTIFIPLTFMVGVWGMNFKTMPELDWEYGYVIAWMAMMGVAALSYWLLKKMKWF